jgi:uncharacterized protein (DUF58 family)
MLADNWAIPLSASFLLGLALEIPALSILALSMALLMWVAVLWRNRALGKISYRRRLHFTRGFPGEEIDVRLEIENKKWLPLPWLQASDMWPKAAAPIDEQVLEESHIPQKGRLVNVFRLPAFGRVRRQYRLRLRERGVYPLGPVRLETSDGLGLYTTHEERSGRDFVTIFPEMASIPRIEFPSASPFGDRQASRRLFEDPSRPMGVRDYQITDEFRRVHWPATARTGKMQAKVFQPTAERVMILCLNTATSERHWEGVYPDVLENLVRTAAAIAQQATQDRYQVGLISNGTMTNSDQSFRILPGRSGQQLSFLLTALAGVTPLVGLPFHRYLLRELPKLPYGTIMVVITAVITPELLETLTEARRRGRKVTLVSLAEEAPPQLSGIQAVHFPQSAYARPEAAA